MWHPLVRLLLFCLMFAHSAPLGAQVRSERLNDRIRVGARIRLVLPGADRHTEGTVRSVGFDSIELADSAGASAFASLTDLDSIQVYQRGSTFATALGGAGFVAGTALYLSWCRRYPLDCQKDGEEDDDDDDWDDEDDEYDERYSVFKLMAFGGAVIGAAIGHALTPLRWHTVPVRVFVAPAQGGGAALFVSVPFGRARRR